MTGQELSLLFDTRIDDSYSDDSQGAPRQRLFDDAFIRTIEDRYRGVGSTQKELDEISEVLVSSGSAVVRNNRVRVRPLPVTLITFNGTIVTFTLATDHDLQVGDSFTISSATGLTGANGTYTATAVSGITVTAADPGISGTFIPGAAKLTFSAMLADYLHMLSVKCRMRPRRNGDRISAMTTGQTTVIEFSIPTAYRSEEAIALTGALGVVGILPVMYLKKLNRYRYQIFSDQYLTTPLVTSGTYQGQATVKRVSTRAAVYFMPDQDISQLSKPTAMFPGVRMADSYLHILPEDQECDLISMDYIRVPSVRIDLNDAVTDLSLHYTERFLNRVVDEAIKLFYESVRDPQQIAVVSQQTQANP